MLDARSQPPKGRDDPGSITCPFHIQIDTREQKPYTFEGLWSGAPGKSPRLIVPAVRECMATGDYGIVGDGGIALERKSKEDLYQSIARKRVNFVDRLERMSTLSFAAVVVEAEWSELLTAPPEHTSYRPKSLCRSIIAWKVRYPRVQWEFMPSRQHAEAFTFRLLERYWLEKHNK